ncbi:MAG: NYN domain-containing protein [Flavobacteriales bacterium]|nr:NYN domain-containing protein [Flavobacteriales bacterium]MBK9289925.1 NYN domain-containing protein [Flavobacteriales bacterium]MBL0035406.1 NYN domain-containing protein [Flavobacteriales bacterium]
MLGNRALKVGVFYDGSYFSHVSNYYNYVHAHHRRLHIGGLHDFVKHMVAEKEGVTPNLCHIIDAHFFRGRFSARDANEKPNQLYYDRVFDDVLMYNGVQTHYLPVKDMQGRKKEKGIDVLMALETYELCMLKRYDVVALIASDGDHVPLVRKLHALGCKTMLLGWDFEFTDEQSGELQTTRTSTDLWNEVTYPLEMANLVDEGLKDNDEVIRELFVLKESTPREVDPAAADKPLVSMSDYPSDERFTGEIMSLHNGYGFIRFPDNNLFFLHDDLIEVPFVELKLGDNMSFTVAVNSRQQRVAKQIKRAEEE